MDNVWDGSETCVAERLVLPISENGEANGVLGYGQYRYRQTDREMFLRSGMVLRLSIALISDCRIG